MTAIDGQDDPTVDEQLYGNVGPSLADMRPPPTTNASPWDWVPQSWQESEDDQFRKAALLPPVQHVGPDGAPVLGPELAPAAAPAPAPGADQPAAAPPPSPALGMAPDATTPAGAPPIPYGANAPPPPMPAPVGPAAPGVADLPGLTVTTEPPPSHANELLADPLRLQDNGPLAPTAAFTPAEQKLALDQIALHDPARFAQIQIDHAAAAQAQAAAERVRIEEENLRQQKASLAAYQEATVKAQADSDRVVADAIALSKTKVDPNRWMSTRSAGQRVAAFLAAVVGGLVQSRTGSSHNLGMDLIQGEIDRDIAAQTQDIESGRYALGVRQNAVAQQFARTGNLYQAQEIVRMATYQAAINKWQTDAQNFDPSGTQAIAHAQAIQEMQTRAIAAKQKMDDRLFDDHLKESKLDIEKRAQAETTRHNRATEAEALRKAAGAGVGAARVMGAAPKYMVDTGFTNPFDASQPLMGARPIGGHGEDAKERKEVAAQISTYGHVQDYWAKLAAIGERIGYSKSLGESAWSKRRDTLGAEYDAAKEALVVYLTKELGDKLTQGQLEAQAHRIPDRTSLFEARDPGKQIAAAQEDADRDFARDMTLVGIDPSPVIRSAQQRRAVATPSPTQDLDAAQQAVAADPTSKDAQAALAAAQQRNLDATALEQQHERDIAAAHELKPPPAPLPEEKGRPAEEVTAIREANRATHAYGELLGKFTAQSGGTAHLRGLKQPGDIAAANRAHEAQLGKLAHDALQARALADSLLAKAHEQLAHRALYERAVRANAMVGAGLDPTAPPLENPPNALTPDRSYAPGADPFTGQSVAVPPPKPKGHR